MIGVVVGPCSFDGGGVSQNYYAQVDTCGNPLEGCDLYIGRIPESNENNNIFGPVPSGTQSGLGNGSGISCSNGNCVFLPFIKKNQ
jgi:hypothetical protein